MQPPNRDISWLPSFTEALDGMLASAQEILMSLRQARAGSLGDQEIDRLLRLYTEQHSFMAFYAGQLRRWSTQRLTLGQKQEVERLLHQQPQLEEAITAILTRAKKLKSITIERIMDMSDVDVALLHLQTMEDLDS